MAKKFDIRINCDETEEIIELLNERELYSSDLLYRVFGVEAADIHSRVREILRKGTDELLMQY